MSSSHSASHSCFSAAFSALSRPDAACRSAGRQFASRRGFKHGHPWPERGKLRRQRPVAPRLSSLAFSPGALPLWLCIAECQGARSVMRNATGRHLAVNPRISERQPRPAVVRLARSGCARRPHFPLPQPHNAAPARGPGWASQRSERWAWGSLASGGPLRVTNVYQECTASAPDVDGPAGSRVCEPEQAKRRVFGVF